MLLSSGVPLIEAMATVARVGGNRVIEDALTGGDSAVGTAGPSRTRCGRRVSPSMVIQFVATGEESGTLPTMLGRRDVYEQQVEMPWRPCRR